MPVTPATNTLLLVDSDPRASLRLEQILRAHDYAIDIVASGHEAVAQLARSSYEAVIVDLDHLGAEAGEEIARSGWLPTTQRLIALTTRPVETLPFLLKPFDAPQLLATIERNMRAATRPTSARQRLVGRSSQMERLFALIDRVAPTRATVLILGETGTGKELVARSIHELSGSSKRPFVPVNCSALPETLLESELFGHTRGSFTGAVAEHRGLFEEANGGTLFLDEISTISHAIQVKLLRVLEDRTIRRVGASTLTPVHFRLIAATNVDLAAEVSAGRFRQDLYYRLNVFPIHVPPLRERSGDIPLLVSHFRQRLSREHGLPAPAIDPDALRVLSAHSWPGNVRELENFVERGVIMQDLAAASLAKATASAQSGVEAQMVAAAYENRWDLARLEREYILEVLRSCGGHRTQAAQILGIDARTLYRKLKSWR